MGRRLSIARTRGTRGIGGGAAAAPAWTPLSISGVTGVFEASDPLLTVVGGVVTVLPDQCGNGDLTPGTGPTYEAAGLGTGPSMLFNGTTQYLRNLGRTALGSQPSSYSMVMVGQMLTSVTGTQAIVAATSGSSRISLGGTSGGLGTFVTSLTGGATSITTSSITGAAMWWGRWNGTQQQAGAGTAAEDTDGATPTYTDIDGGRLSIGATSAGTNLRNIRVGALYLVRGYISDDDIARLYTRAQSIGWL